MSYRFLTIFLWPVFFIYTLKIALRDKSKRYFLQRLGFSYPKQRKHTLWIHCASVGEVNTYLPLHLKLLSKFPETQFVITTNTCTGASTVKKLALQRTTHCYLPIESGFAIKRFLYAWQPQQCLVMETEIWPLLYKYCHKQNIQLSIINARLSHRTLSANNWLKKLYKRSLTYVSKILCKSDIEFENFETLGANKQQLIVAGNLKFATKENTQSIQPVQLNKFQYCVAASTHHDEEKQLAELWSSLETNLLLVIVPRHPNRSEQIQAQLMKLAINFSVRSKQQEISPDTRIYLADTLGELGSFIAGSEFVFIGGSLINHGGQNILEAARSGKAAICGPHMFNFKDELELLLDNQGCIQVKDINELETTISHLLSNPAETRSIGNNAKQAVQQQSNILDNYLPYI